MIQLQNLFDYLLINFDIRLAIDESNHINMAYCRAKVDEPVKRLDDFAHKSLSESFPEGFASLLQEKIKPVFSIPHSNVGLLNYNYNGALYTVHFDFVEFPEGIASGRISLTGTETRTDWLILQRNLAWRISEANDLDSIFAYILRTATLSGYMDGGGVYLFNEEFNRLDLQYHVGLSEAFIDLVNSFTPKNPEWQIVTAGQPVYFDGSNVNDIFKEKLDMEGINTFASIPLINDGQVIGVMNLVSHRSQFISVIHKRYIEDLASILADAIKRIQRQKVTGKDSQNYLQLMESFPDQVVVIDFNGTIKYVNQRLCQRLGYLADDLTGENIARLFVLDGHNSMINIINDLAQQENSHFDIPMLTKSGEVVNLESQSSHSIWDLQNVLVLTCRENNKGDNLRKFNAGTHFEQVIELIPTPALIVEAATLEIKQANLLFHKKFGYFDQENRTDSLLDLFDQFEQDRLATIIRQQGISGLTSSKIWALKQLDGSIIDVSLEVIRIPWIDNETCLVHILPQLQFGFSYNLIREDRYRDVVDEQLDIICRFTPEGLLTFVNNAYCELFNKKPEEILGLTFSNNIHQEDLGTVSAHLSKISQEHPVRYSQNRMIDGNGMVRWINWVDRGIYKDGKLMEIQGVGRDITEDMNAKLNSDSLEKRYQNLIEEMPVVVYILHASTLHPLYISPHIFTLTGYTMDEIYQARGFLIDMIHPDDRALLKEGYDQRIHGHKNVVLRYRMFHKDGHTIWLQDMGSMIEAEDGTDIFQGLLMEIGTWHLTEGKMAIVQKFELLIKELSHKLLITSQHEWPDLVNYILASIGDLIQADRSYIFDFSLNNTIMSNTYEWCAENIEPQIDNLKNLPVENFKFFIETLTEKEIVSYSNLNQIPENENYLRQHLEKQNIQSILVIPMKKHGQLCGYLGFDSVQKEVVWDDQAIFLLRMVGDMLIKNQERLTAVL